tara:strand:+ start:193 stop:417 length:225 start_codon:yes stop_codon:yes gene_type:complete
MKFALVLFLCSYTADACLQPYPFPIKFDDEYTCLIEGYNQSILKMEEIGKKEVNEHSIYIKFVCAGVEPKESET